MESCGVGACEFRGGSGASEMVPVNGKRQDRKRKQIRQKRTDINKLKANTKRIT